MCSLTIHTHLKIKTNKQVLHASEKPDDWIDKMKIILQTGKTSIQKVKSAKEGFSEGLASILSKIHRDADIAVKDADQLTIKIEDILGVEEEEEEEEGEGEGDDEGKMDVDDDVADYWGATADSKGKKKKNKSKAAAGGKASSSSSSTSGAGAGAGGSRRKFKESDRSALKDAEELLDTIQSEYLSHITDMMKASRPEYFRFFIFISRLLFYY
jgi:histone H3/H4